MLRAGLDGLAAGTCRDPHQLLGIHRDGDQVVVRAWRPDATAATLEGRAMRRIPLAPHPRGVPQRSPPY